VCQKTGIGAHQPAEAKPLLEKAESSSENYGHPCSTAEALAMGASFDEFRNIPMQPFRRTPSLFSQ
jgi:hypothetical protein